jgi:D-amino peptidase
MRVLIAADMEGVTGVVHWDQVDPDHGEYGRFRKLMTQDVNAAVEGAFGAGADEVFAVDGHAYGRNLLVEALDPRAELHSGSPSPLSMVTSVETGVEGVLFVGYHARAGAERAILDHTWSGSSVTNIWLNDRLVGETGINAALCGHFGAPVLMVSGDQSLCREAVELLGEIETAQVKEATGRMAARCLPPEVTQKMIREAARRGVSRLLTGDAPVPFRPTSPITLSIEFQKSQMADQAVFLPGARRDERRVSFTADEMPIIYDALRALLALAR